MDAPDVPAALAVIERRGLVFDPDDVTYFIGAGFTGLKPSTSNEVALARLGHALGL